jgi:hypothetical protein
MSWRNNIEAFHAAIECVEWEDRTERFDYWSDYCLARCIWGGTKQREFLRLQAMFRALSLAWETKHWGGTGLFDRYHGEGVR